MKILTELSGEKLVLVNFKAFPREIASMKKQAEKYAGGNLSLWIRYACQNFKPVGKKVNVSKKTTSTRRTAHSTVQI